MCCTLRRAIVLEDEFLIVYEEFAYESLLALILQSVVVVSCDYV